MRGLILSLVAIMAVAGIGFGANVGPETPNRTAIIDTTLAASGKDSVVCTGFNGVSIDWNSPPTLRIYGLGIGSNTGWNASGWDTISAATLTELNATGWDFTMYDLSVIVIDAGSSGCRFVLHLWDW